MIKMTLGEWGKMIFSKSFIVKNINYEQGETIVYDALREVTYSATYNKKTMKLELEEIDDTKKKTR